MARTYAGFWMIFDADFPVWLRPHFVARFCQEAAFFDARFASTGTVGIGVGRDSAKHYLDDG